MNLKEALIASIELENDPGVRAFRSINKRIRPDLTNKSDTDVLEWMQRVEKNAADFFEEYSTNPSCSAFEHYAEEIVDCAKRLIIAIQDARERAGILE